MTINVNNETGLLKTVILGLANDRGNELFLNNPRYKFFDKRGYIPDEGALVSELESFKRVLEKFGVNVLRPENLPGVSQIFCRDIAFAIGDKFILANLRVRNRQRERQGLDRIIENFANVIIPPNDVYIEGGDIIVHDNYVFIGIGGRTNYNAVDFLRNELPDKEVIPLTIRQSENAKKHVLHLDTAFQPIGVNNALLYRDGITSGLDSILDVFSGNKIIEINEYQAFNMYSNVFSISPDLIIVESTFNFLIEKLSKNGIQVCEVPYENISKLGGLFRCSTCPVYREDN
ncbi:MAG: arginine deiminase family protein [Bacteroidota bacterium]